MSRCDIHGENMPSPLFHPEIMDHDVVISSQHGGVGLSRETEQESREEDHQEALRFALDQLSLMALEKVDGGGGLVDSLDGTQVPGSEGCNGVGGGGYVDLQMLDHANGSRDSPSSCSPSPEYYGSGGYHMAGSHSMIHGEQSSVLCNRKRSVNMTECVPVPSSEHVAEIVGRQGERTGCMPPNRERVCASGSGSGDRVCASGSGSVEAACSLLVLCLGGSLLRERGWGGARNFYSPCLMLGLCCVHGPRLRVSLLKRVLCWGATRPGVYLHAFLRQCVDNA